MNTNTQKRLQDQVALITGAGQGVGQGIAFALAADGAQIAVVGRTESKLLQSCEEIKKRGGKALPIVCDVVDRAQIENCVETVIRHFGCLQILVNNAQIVPLGTLLEMEDEQYQQGIDSGPLATLRFMQLCHPHLAKNDRSSIINLASSSALRWDMRGYGAYAAAKEAIRCLTRTAANEWGGDGIHANCILPLASSPALAWWAENRPEEAAKFLQAVPLGRIGDCEQDIGQVVSFLCRKESDYITGQSIMLDGGRARLG